MTVAPSQNESTDLVLERTIKASVRTVWRCLTEAEHLKAWMAPTVRGQWSTARPRHDRGVFRFDMRSPDETQSSDNTCCFLEVVPHERIVWTNAMLPGYRPAGTPGFVPFFSAIISLMPEGKWTKYHVRVVHADEAGRARHEELGFFDGWNTVLTQMAERAEAAQLSLGD